MTYFILNIAIFTIVTGIFIGLICVCLIYCYHQFKTNNSLIKPEKIIGIEGIVEVPFDFNSKGKISVNIQQKTLYLTAVTNDNTSFNRGDRVLIINIKDNKVWVVSEDLIKTSQTNQLI